MKSVHIVSVGKLREEAYKKVESQYFSRISTFKTYIHELKSRDDDVAKEGQDVVKKISELKKKKPLPVILLTEKGKSFSSHDFSAWFYKKVTQDDGLILVIGGAAGHGADVYAMGDEELSLSPLTFPHHMVRALIAEQLYRAETIYQGHPYSK